MQNLGVSSGRVARGRSSRRPRPWICQTPLASTSWSYDHLLALLDANGFNLEELIDDCVQRVDRFCAVDRDAKLRAAVEPLRVPRAERPQLVDDPPLPPPRGRRGSVIRRR